MTQPIDYAIHHIQGKVHELHDVDPAHKAHHYKEIIVTLLEAIDRVNGNIAKLREMKANMQSDVVAMTSETLLDVTLEAIEESITKTLYGEDVN